jgi:hypothetical protein
MEKNDEITHPPICPSLFEWFARTQLDLPRNDDPHLFERANNRPTIEKMPQAIVKKLTIPEPGR